jgi:hypothetical protein
VCSSDLVWPLGVTPAELRFETYEGEGQEVKNHK